MLAAKERLLGSNSLSSLMNALQCCAKLKDDTDCSARVVLMGEWAQKHNAALKADELSAWFVAFNSKCQKAPCQSMFT